MLALPAAILAGCGPAPRADLATAVQPAEVARALCLQTHPGDDPACQNIQLPDHASTQAYATCLDYHRLDVKACKDLRPAYEEELRAYLASPAARAGSSAPAPDRRPTVAQQSYVPYRTAAALYKATSTDAQTFTAALLIPDVRRKVEAALQQSLSDEKLRQLADQARSESLHWYAYMQRLERSSESN